MRRGDDGERSRASVRHAKVAIATQAIDANARAGGGGFLPTKRPGPGFGHHCREACLASQ